MTKVRPGRLLRARLAGRQVDEALDTRRYKGTLIACGAETADRVNEVNIYSMVGWLFVCLFVLSANEAFWFSIRNGTFRLQKNILTLIWARKKRYI